MRLKISSTLSDTIIAGQTLVARFNTKMSSHRMEVSLTNPTPEYLPMYPLCFTPFRCLQDDILSYIQFRSESKAKLVRDGSVHLAVVLRLPARCALDPKVRDFYGSIILPRRFGGSMRKQEAKTTINYHTSPITNKKAYGGTVTFTMRRLGPLPIICPDLALVLPGGYRRDNSLKAQKGAIRIIGFPICKRCSHITGHATTCDVVSDIAV